MLHRLDICRHWTWFRWIVSPMLPLPGLWATMACLCHHQDYVYSIHLALYIHIIKSRAIYQNRFCCLATNNVPYSWVSKTSEDLINNVNKALEDKNFSVYVKKRPYASLKEEFCSKYEQTDRQNQLLMHPCWGNGEHVLSLIKPHAWFFDLLWAEPLTNLVALLDSGTRIRVYPIFGGMHYSQDEKGSSFDIHCRSYSYSLPRDLDIVGL